MKFEFDTRVLPILVIVCVVIVFFAAIYLAATPSVQTTNFDRPHPIGRKIAVSVIDRDMTFNDYDVLLEIQQEFIEYRWERWNENWVDAGNVWDGWKTEFYARRVS